MIRRLIQTVGITILLLFLLVFIGAITFSIIEGRTLLDSFYYMITVLTTVGFGDITPQTPLGKIHFVIVILLGLALFGYFISSVSSVLSEDRLAKIFPVLYGFGVNGEKLRNHVIIIGWNEYAKNAYQEITMNGVDAVVVVPSEEEAKMLIREGIPAYAGSLDDDKLYRDLAFDRARGVILTEPDPTKLIIDILKIKKRMPSTPITAIIYSSEVEDIVRQAGATFVLNIAEVGGRLLANSLIEPKATYLEIDMLKRGGLDLMEYDVKENLRDETVGEVAEMIGSEVLALVRDDEYIIKPDRNMRLKEGDKLILMGYSDQMQKDMERLNKVRKS